MREFFDWLKYPFLILFFIIALKTMLWLYYFLDALIYVPGWN